MAEPSLEQRTKAWNSIAKSYLDTLEYNHLPAAITLSQMTGIKSAKNILEVGSGTGLLAQYWTNLLSPGTKYTVTDLSDEMLRIGQERRVSLNNKPEGVEFIYRPVDAENLDFVPDDSVDAYISNLCINGIPHPEKAVKEAFRVVRKGGRIGISINSPNDKNFFQKLIRDTGAELEIEELKNFARAAMSEKPELLKAAQDAGIKVEYCWDQDSAYDTNEERVVSMCQENPLIKKVLNRFGEDVQVKYGEVLRKNYREAMKSLVPVKSNFIFLVGSKPE